MTNGNYILHYVAWNERLQEGLIIPRANLKFVLLNMHSVLNTHDRVKWYRPFKKWYGIQNF